MSSSNLNSLLRETWADRSISRGEKKALSALAAESAGAPAELRAAAFALADELAREGFAPASDILEWLGDVVKAVTQSPAADAASGLRATPGGVPSEAWFAPHQDVCGRIVRAFQEARATADVCVFTVTDDRIAKAMIDAHRRGVKVRLVSDDMKSGDLGSDIERIAAAGIAVRIDRTPAHMHHKFAIFDGRILLNGSYNWTRSAGRENCENLVVACEDGLLASFKAEFELVWGGAETFR